MRVHVCGVDVGNTVFHLVGLSKKGHIVSKERFSRKQLVTLWRTRRPTWPILRSAQVLTSSPVFFQTRSRRETDACRVCPAVHEVQ